MRQELRSGAHGETTAIRIPKKRSLATTIPEQLFVTSGVTAGEFTEDLKQVMSFMIGKRSPRAGFPISYFELFVHGLTNIVRSLYFGMDLASTVAEAHLQIDKTEVGMVIAEQEYSFLFDYLKFLVSQDLAIIDFGDCLIDWNDRLMVPTFLAPLTSRGRNLVDIVGTQEDQLRTLGVLSSEQHLRVAQERFLTILFTPTDIGRIPLVRSFEAQCNVSNIG